MPNATLPAPLNPRRTSLALSAAVLCAAAAGGCSLLGSSGSTSLVVESAQHGGALSSSFTTAFYLPTDNNTADIYLSDLPLESLTDPAADLRDRAGQIIHIHLFLMPIAGRTPIDSTACNFTVRHIVLAGGQAGMYSGGGFILPASEPGSRWFTASIRDATLRLARTDAGFSDRLGVSRLSGTISVQRDEERARSIAGRIEALVNSLPEAPASDAYGWDRSQAPTTRSAAAE